MPKTRAISVMIVRTAAYAAALATLGWATAAVAGGGSGGAGGVAPEAKVESREAALSTQTASLLVPKRTRLVIKFERTAVC